METKKGSCYHAAYFCCQRRRYYYQSFQTDTQAFPIAPQLLAMLANALFVHPVGILSVQAWDIWFPGWEDESWEFYTQTRLCSRAALFSSSKDFASLPSLIPSKVLHGSQLTQTFLFYLLAFQEPVYLSAGPLERFCVLCSDKAWKFMHHFSFDCFSESECIMMMTVIIMRKLQPAPARPVSILSPSCCL